MTATKGLHLAVDETGTGPSVVFVHGSWSDGHAWDLVTPVFTDAFRVVTYDRRGHSQSPQPPGPAGVDAQVADLASLIEERDLGPAHLVGNSYGGTIVLRLSIERPDLVASVSAHEPSASALVRNDPAMQEHLATLDRHMVVVRSAIADGHGDRAAAYFVDNVLAPGTWKQLPEVVRQTMINNAPTFADWIDDPEADKVPVDGFASLRLPVQLTAGSQGVPELVAAVRVLSDALPAADMHIVEGWNHIPHRTHPVAYGELVRSFIEAAG